ncbi:hypothetical protein E2562_032864 [Oryza meyeriana var. granulata]|uniref:Uncharacterized protein n=1 Tax=Oryza meyeriana var. granulata TaxID=110450 RepID=A0A6G1BPD4_9ORYZ|nr:hypothetical protein E2562_032864 [Oryza meyeriana var. granulata]
MAAMQDHPSPPDAATGIDDHPAALAYVCLIVQELRMHRSPGRNSSLRLRLCLLLRRRPHGVRFPAAVAAALDDLEDLYSAGTAPMAAFVRHRTRRKRAKHEESLQRAMSQRLSVTGRIRSLAIDSSATRNSLEEAREFIRRTLRLLPVAVSEQHGGAEATSAHVVSLVELLSHLQGRETALVATMEAMKTDHKRLLRQHDAAEAAELTEKAALEDIPELPRATEEEDQLIYEAAGRFLDNFTVLVKFL